MRPLPSRGRSLFTPSCNLWDVYRGRRPSRDRGGDVTTGMSMSVSVGPVAGRDHNVSREYREGLANVDAQRTRLNVVLADRDLADVYAERFGNALEEYNAAQREKGHPERQVTDYLGKVRSGKQEKPSYEMVVQLGNRLTNPASDEWCRATSAKVYEDFMARFRERFPHLDVVRAAIHMDEATPHLHVEYVPWSSGNTRGLGTRNSLRGAIRQMGMKDVRELNQAMFGVLEDVSREHGIERVDMGCEGMRRLDVRAFKDMCRDAERDNYPYRNDPRLVELVEEAMVELTVANETIDEQVAVMQRAARDAGNPLRAAETRRALTECLERTKPARTALEALTRAVRDALAGVPAYWREHLINPVSEKLRAARERFGTWLADQQPDVTGNKGLLEDAAET